MTVTLQNVSDELPNVASGTAVRPASGIGEIRGTDGAILAERGPLCDFGSRKVRLDITTMHVVVDMYRLHLKANLRYSHHVFQQKWLNAGPEWLLSSQLASGLGRDSMKRRRWRHTLQRPL